MRCKYHPENLNVSCCHNCGNPICELCITEMPSWIMGFGYPDICPRCKQKKMNFNIKIIVIIFSFLLIYPFIFLFYQLLDIFYQSGNFIFAFGFFLFFFIIFLKERKKYQHWTKSIRERTISNEEIQHLIQNKQLKTCYYHNKKPSINNCEDCGKNICTNCSVIYYRYFFTYFSCIECFWKKRKRDIKFLMYISGSFLVLFLFILFFAIIIFLGRGWGKTLFSFYIIILLIGLFYGIFFFSSLNYYYRIKKKYIKWKKEIEINK